MSALFFSWVAGVLTTLNPCVLPVLPIVLASAFTHGRLGALSLAAGMVVSFTLIGTTLAASGHVLGVPDTAIRTAAAVMFVGFGLVLVLASAQSAFAGALAPLANAASALAARASAFGLAGQAAIGALLGVVWAPCSGPTLGAAIALAAQAEGFGPAMMRMLAFSLGATSVLLLLAIGSRAAVSARRDRLIGLATRAKPAMGVVLVAVGAAVLTGYDKVIEAGLVALMPEWLVAAATSV